MNKIFYKIIAVFLMAGTLFPGTVFAFDFIGATDNSVPTADSKTRANTSFIGDDSIFEDEDLKNKFLQLGIGTLFGDNAAKAISEVGKDLNKTIGTLKKAQCITAEVGKVLNAADKIDSWTFGGLKLLVGDTGEAGMLKTKIKILSDGRECLTTYIQLVKDKPAATVVQFQQKQTILDELTRKLNAMDTRLDELNQQYRTATRSLWKTLLVSTLLKTTKSISERLVNGLTNKYKISDIQRYSDAVASQVYTTQLIQRNAQDGQEQLILRSMLNNPLPKSLIKGAVFQRADAALGFDPDSIDLNDPDFAAKMTSVVAGEANPFLARVALEDKALGLGAKSRESAEKEISIGNGFKAPRNCSGNLAEQAAVDQNYKAASREFVDRQKLLKDLEKYRDAMKNFTADEAKRIDADILKAKKDFDIAASKLQKLPSAYNNEPLKVICESIASPASSVDKGIDHAFQQFTKNLGDYNDNNLPFFVKFISGIGERIGNSLIFGGNINKTTILSESNQLEKLTAYAWRFAGSTGQEDVKKKEENLSKGVTFDYDSGSSSGEYVLEWEINSDSVKRASYVTIKGAGISDTVKMPLTGRAAIKTSIGGTYILKVFDANNAQLTSASIELVVPAGNPYLSSGSGPRVFGASVKKPLLELRGPVE